MKLSTIFLACSASAAETTDSPISKLNYLETIATQIFSSDSFRSAGRGRLGRRWGNRWTKKFMTYTERMEKHFARCGTTPSEADDDLNEEYDIDNTCGAIEQLTTRFSNWVDRHMSSCNGQKNHSHHEKRMERWQNLLQTGNGFDLSFSD